MLGREYEDGTTECSNSSSKVERSDLDKTEPPTPTPPAVKVFGSKTFQLPIDNESKSPYRKFFKYTVEEVGTSLKKAATAT